ncbi:hypothetical protein AB1L88_25800 [Tautonia sp. JC769]|uniref:hypothetical protein n=1 Tax=Tautonia sp. JC769 TaxID=3232135 RepID=UPI0034582247
MLRLAAFNLIDCPKYEAGDLWQAFLPVRIGREEQSFEDLPGGMHGNAVTKIRHGMVPERR